MIKNRKKIKIIPLGQNCMPRTILTRWKIKPSKLMGEPTYPFDLAVFGIPEITKILKTDFIEFFDNLEYNNNLWIKTPNCIYFSHDKKFSKDDKYSLIKQYTKRIENFRKAILQTEPIVFIQILGDTQEISEQYKELKRIRNSNPFKFLIIDTENIVNEEFSEEEIIVKKVPYPNRYYKNNWWRKEYYKSPEGIEFEKQIADFCLDNIKNIMSI